MRFSVVIPVYNGERYLSEAIESVLSQKRSVDEIVVYDDCSTDGSRDICHTFGNALKMVYGKNGPSGFVKGWNKAIGCASGDYVAVLHQDDLLYPDFFMEIESALQRNPDVRHLFAVCDYIDEVSRVISAFPSMENFEVRYSGNAYVKAYQKTYGSFPHIHRCPGVVTHRSVFEFDGCIYREEAGHIADDDFFYRVGQFTDVVGLLVPLAAYRLHSHSATGALQEARLTERLAKDYLFQVEEWRNSSFLDHEDKAYFEYWALRYLSRTLISALRSGDSKQFKERSENFQSLVSKGIDKKHLGIARKIRYILRAEKIAGFGPVGFFLRNYAQQP